MSDDFKSIIKLKFSFALYLWAINWWMCGWNLLLDDEIIFQLLSKGYKSNLFKNIENPFNAARYHSLIVENNSLPSTLEITATTDDQIIMAIQHKKHPIFGVQFHPESIATNFGHELLKNFLSLKK